MLKIMGKKIFTIFTLCILGNVVVKIKKNEKHYQSVWAQTACKGNQQMKKLHDKVNSGFV